MRKIAKFLLIFLIFCRANYTNADMEFTETLRIGLGSANAIAWDKHENLLWVGGSYGLWVFNTQLVVEDQFIEMGFSIQSMDWDSFGERLAIGDNEGNIHIYLYNNDRLTLLFTITTNLDEIRQILWSNDNSYIAVHSLGRQVGIWNTETGDSIPLPEFTSFNFIDDLQWKPGIGNEISFASATQGLIFWNIDSNEVRQVMSETRFYKILWAPNGNTFLAISQNSNFIWQNFSHSEPIEFQVNDVAIEAVVWDHESSLLIIGDTVGNLYRWNNEDIIPLSDGLDSGIKALSWSNDETFLAVLSLGNTLQIRNRNNFDEISRFDEFNGWINDIAWSPDGNYLASVWGRNQEIRIFSSESGEMILTIPHSFTYELAWSPNGTTIASSYTNGQLLLHNASTGNIQNVLSGDENGWLLLALDWHPEGTMLVTANAADLSIWSVKRNEEVSQLHLQGSSDREVSDVDWSPDGGIIMSTVTDGTVRLWDVSTGQQLYSVSGIRNSVWSPDGAQFASINGDQSNEIYIRDLSNPEEIVILDGSSPNLLTLAWSSDGTMIAAGGVSNNVYIWDANTGDLLQILTMHTDTIIAVEWHPFINSLAIASRDGTISIWSS